MDNLTKDQRKKCMTNIKNGHTKPENTVRKALMRRGIRYKMHVDKLQGNPDFVIPKLHKVIFINGCFWHQHPHCKYSVKPKTSRDYWLPKLNRNVEKQKADIKSLKKDGWKTYILWECQLKDAESINNKISKILA
jgi:DNA mismatch endonuclease (patch repair protein)